MKLQSLKDRPATKEDINKAKKLYHINGEIEYLDNKITYNDKHPSEENIAFYVNNFSNKEKWFWQKPVLISETEYNNLLSERKVVIDKIVRWASKKKDGEAFILSGRGAKTEDMDLEVLDYPHHYCIDAMDDLIKYLNDQTKEVL